METDCREIYDRLKEEISKEVASEIAHTKELLEAKYTAQKDGIRDALELVMQRTLGRDEAYEIVAGIVGEQVRRILLKAIMASAVAIVSGISLVALYYADHENRHEKVEKTIEDHIREYVEHRKTEQILFLSKTDFALHLCKNYHICGEPIK